MAQLNVKENAFSAVRELLKISVDEVSAEVRVRGIDKRMPGEVMRDLFGAMEALGAADELRGTIGEYFAKAFVRPVLSVHAVSVVKNGGSDETSSVFAVKLDDSEGKKSSAEELCGVVSGAISFVNQAFGAGSELTLWSSQCGIDISSLVVERCFLNDIPTKRSGLTEFTTVTDSLVAFERQLAELHMLDNDDSRPITSVVGRLDEIYASQRCDAALKSARVLAENSKFAIHDLSQHETWSIDLVRELVGAASSDVSPQLADAVNKIGSGHVFPKCTISQTANQLLAEAYKL
ncbi:hypothetical protein FBU59_007339, partial [Linderina macrospora]